MRVNALGTLLRRIESLSGILIRVLHRDGIPVMPEQLLKASQPGLGTHVARYDYRQVLCPVNGCTGIIYITLCHELCEAPPHLLGRNTPKSLEAGIQVCEKEQINPIDCHNSEKMVAVLI
jgi:hypothetical protein